MSIDRVGLLRRLLTVAVSVLALGASVCVGATIAAASPAAAASSGGGYVAVTPTRVLNTRAGAGPQEGTVAGKSSITLQVAGRDRLPDSGIAAVVLNVTVTNASSVGYVTAYADDGDPQQQPPTASSVNFMRGQTVPNLVIAPVGTDGKVRLYNGSVDPVDLIADLSGYYLAGTPAAQGGFGSIVPTRVLDTRTGGSSGAVAGGQSVAFAVTGNGVPGHVSAVVLNVTAVSPTAVGFVTAYATGSARPSASNLNIARGQTVANLVVAPVNADGEVSLYNGSAGSVQLVADVSGYFTAADPVTAGAFASLSPTRLLDTRDGTGGVGGAVAANRSIAFTVEGSAGVPLQDVSAVVLNVTAVEPTKVGYVTAYADGSAVPGVSNLNLTPGQTKPNLVLAPVGSDGKVALYNGSGGTVDLVADVSGYVLAANAPLPTTSTSRYVSSLSAISDSSASGEGCSDAQQQPSLVLLDVGAQTVTPPLSSADPGVALVLNTDPVVRVSYPNLVTALDGYLTGFAACAHSGVTTKVAVGTSNDGAFSGTNAYAATQRGTDWANQVIDKLTPHTGITIAGADDIESDFASTEAQAEQWVTSFLQATSAPLVYNGSADNCPTSYGSPAECGPVRDDNGVTKTWTRAQYVNLTYRLGRGRISVLPQIYFPSQAIQWSNIDTTSGNNLQFVGSLTQDGVCHGVSTCGFTASQGWAALYHGLSTFQTPSLPTATDLQPQ